MRRRMPAEEVRPIAEELLARILPACDRAEIVGSLRRELAEVGDIEILAAPKIEPLGDLFGAPSGQVRNLLDELASEMVESGELSMRQFPRTGRSGQRGLWDAADSSQRWGTRYKAAVYRGIPVDLFCCIEPAQWGVLMLIRTGPAEFAKRFVTQRAKGGVLPDWAVVHHGAIYHQEELQPIATPEEEDVFRVLGLGVIPPRYRVSADSWPHLMYGF